MGTQDNGRPQQDGARETCHVQLPASLVEAMKEEAHRLTGHKRRGFSDLLAICALHGWKAYQDGDLVVEKKVATVNYRLVGGI